MTTPKHTPTPWRLDDPQANRPNIVSDRGLVASTEHGPDDGRPNAALIVRAVNAHAALVEALERIVNAHAAMVDDFEEQVVEIAKAALRAAKGES